MSDSEEQKSCGVCADFEPQTWRKSLCKHCFHALEEHSKEMLAQQSQAVATEQGADRSSGAPAETCSSKAETKSEATESDLTREEGKGANSEKDVPTKMAKTRFGASKDTSQWSWAKDLGHEYGKSVKPGSHTTTKSTQENQPAPSSSSTPSAPTLASSSKPSVKTSPPSLSSTEISTSSLSKTTSGTTNTAASDTATTMSMSKAKTFASKFEAKASGLTKDKPCWKPPEVRPGSANVAALTGKLTETISDSKSSSKLPAEPQKLSAPQKINSKSAKLSGVVSKTDSPETYADKEVVSTDDSKEDKSDHIAQKLQLAGSKQDSWNKLSVSPDSKSRPSGKEFMRSSKEPGKDDSVHKKTEESKSDFSPAKHDDSGCSSQNSFRDSSSEITYKSKDISLVKSENERNDDKQKKNEHLMILQTSSDITGAWQSDSKMAALNVSCADRLGQHTETASINNLANSAGNSLAVQTRQLCQENTGESKDEDGAEGKCLNRQTEQQTLSVGLTAEIDKLVKESDKRDNVAEDTSQSSVCSDMQVSSSSPVSSSSSKAITSTDSLLSSKFLNSTTDAERKQQSFHLDTSTESRSLQSSLEKFTSPEKPCSFQSPISPGHHANQDKADNGNKDEGNEKSSLDVKENIEKLNEELKEKEDKLSSMTILMSQMQEKVRSLEEERDQLKRASIQSQKSDLEKMLNDLKTQLSNMERQCSQLETDNQSLIDKLRVQEANVKRDQECRGKNSDNIVLEQDLEAAEKELEDLKEENKELQRNIMEMKNEMEEMHDHFREHEHDEFRELQKELDLTAKNCRILQYKLRKAERRNDQIEADRLQYEEKLKMLQDKFDSQDAKHHIRVLEDELRVAKEVSARLRDELDIIEDKRDKALEENRHLTQLLEHTDKRQFRMEMEIDKLRDIVADLKQQLKEVKGGNNKESTPERKPALAVVGKQGSREYDVSQLMKDLYDSMERENDLKDQLKFTEEEAKMMRKRVSEMDEENENLRVQLQKMSEKASKQKKKEKERQKELEEERRHHEAYRTALSPQTSHVEDRGDDSSDVILVVGPDGSDLIHVDEMIPLTQRKDSTDDDLMNAMQMRVQLEMLEQELMTSHKKLDEMDLENENLQAEVKFLQERLAEREALSSLPEPSTPNAYYEDRLREVNQEVDELRWKLIEKDRELERMTAVQASQTRQSREHGHKKEKLKKSKSLEEADHVHADLRKQLDQAHMDIIHLKKTIENMAEQNEELRNQNEELQSRTPIPSVQADDAAVKNIELKENVRKLEEISRGQVEKIKSLTENLQKLARDTRSYTNTATSPTSPGTLSIPGIPLLGPAQAGVLDSRDDVSTRDLRAQLHVIVKENEELRRLINGLQAGRRENIETQLPGTLSGHASLSPGTETKKEARVEESPGRTEQVLTCTQDTEEAQARDKSHTSNTTDCQLSYSLELDSLSSAMDGEKEVGKTSTISATTKKDHVGGKTQESGKEIGVAVVGDRASKVKDVNKDEQCKSILLDYPEAKSKVAISGSESRVELMAKVLEMDEEISDLVCVVRKREEDCEQLKREVSYLNIQLREVKDESRRTELDLLQELDMLHDKNSVMSNLLDIINERAEAAEEELERRMQEDNGQSPVRSASNVSQVSALSDTSMGSDEVFLNTHVTKEGIITRDWETKLKVRIESLERLLAEERQKVCMAEKKLILAGIDSVSPSVSDDVKLRIREKELLQEELVKSQRHLHIATDQIQGLKERLHIVEDEHERLKKDYAKLYDEIDKPLDKDDVTEQNVQSSDKNLDLKVESECPFVAKRISVVEAPQFREAKRVSEERKVASDEIARLQQELSSYKEKAKELEYKVEEINDIWRSKSAASDRERDELELQLNQKIQEMSTLEETVLLLKQQLSAKEKIITENDAALKEKEQELSRLAGIMKDHEEESKKLELEKQTLLEQVSLRESTIRSLNETIRIRDERLKEKDDILFKLNTSIENQKRELKSLGDKILRTAENVKEKDSEIASLKNQLSNSSSLSREMTRGCQTDAEKENSRLKEALKKLQGDLDKATADKRTLESSLEKSRRALDDAMMMWDKDRHTLQRDVNILEEKVRMYEAFNTMNKDETIETLKVEAQGYFNEKESLVCELSSLKLRHETDERIHKEQIAKLQGELTEKLRLLKAEVDNNSHINTELNRLKRQAEMAYRLQQEQRVFKAEHLAMKVRYETRIDKMSKEHNKMFLTIEKLQKERDIDKQIIDNVQKNLNMVKDKYTEELLRSQDDKATLHRYVKEIEELREHLEDLQKHIRDLRDKTVDQDRLRSELINKFATERSSWEIERANLNSQINELDERLNSSSRQHDRSKDIQVNMGMAWEKERREQKRLLAEAHTLALDLQEQLRSRDEASAHERKEMLHQMESDRLAWSKDKREIERKLMEAESTNRKMAALEKRVKDVQERAEKDSEVWNKEKLELVRLAAEARHAHARDTKKVENVLSKLIRLRELGIMLTSQPKWDSLEEKPPDRPENTEQSMIDYVKEAVLQVSQAADDLTVLTNPVQEEEDIKSSEMDLLKDEFSCLHQETNDAAIVADVATSSMMMMTKRVQEESSGISHKFSNNAGIRNIPSSPHSVAIAETLTTSHDRTLLTSPQGSVGLPTSRAQPSFPTGQSSVPVTMRPLVSASRHYDCSPSYTSGTRSATSSRATTPEALERTQASSGASSGSRFGFIEPPVISHHKVSQAQDQGHQSVVASGRSSMEKVSPKRPAAFIKSLSMDSASIIDSRISDKSAPPRMTSISANTTPVQPVTTADVISSFSRPGVTVKASDHLHPGSSNVLSRVSATSQSMDKLSPRTARRKFFEDYPTSSSSFNPIGYLSWPDRRSVSPALHVRQTSFPGPEEVQREAEEEHDLVSSRLESWEKHPTMKSSTSWDEQMHRKDATSVERIPVASLSASLPRTHQAGEKSGTAKEKRRLFKRATSLDSPIGSSIAKVGVAAMPPGAPTGFTPSELFAAVKGKLKPAFKKKQTDSALKGKDPRSPSPLFIQTEVPDIHFASHGTTSLPVPVPRVDVSQSHPPDDSQGSEFVGDQAEERARDSHRTDIPRGKWRSKSADRAHATLVVHGDVIRAQPGVWQFNETAV